MLIAIDLPWRLLFESEKNQSIGCCVLGEKNVRKKSSRLKPSLDWFLIFVPIATALRFFRGLENPTVLFLVSCTAIIPLAGGALNNPARRS